MPNLDIAKDEQDLLLSSVTGHMKTLAKLQKKAIDEGQDEAAKVIELDVERLKILQNKLL